MKYTSTDKVLAKLGGLKMDPPVEVSSVSVLSASLNEHREVLFNGMIVGVLGNYYFL